MRVYPMPERARLRSWTIGASIFVAVALFGLVIWQGASPPDSSTKISAPILLQDKAKVLPDRASLLTLPSGDITVLVPCCSFGVGGTVSIVDAEPNLFPDPPGEQVWNRPRIVNIEYYDPDGKLVPFATSSTPVEICFSLSDALWEQCAQEPDRFAIQYYDDRRDPAKWRSMDTTDKAQQRSLCTQSDHLSLFALAILQPVPEKTPNEPYTP